MRFAFTVFVLILTIASEANVSAQPPAPPTWSPYQQRLSPYLDLLRNDNSVLHPYQSFVLPRRQFQQSLQQQSARIGQLEQRVLPTSPSPTRYSVSPRMQTGRGGRFQSYLHYYPSVTSPPRR